MSGLPTDHPQISAVDWWMRIRINKIWWFGSGYPRVQIYMFAEADHKLVTSECRVNKEVIL